MPERIDRLDLSEEVGLDGHRLEAGSFKLIRLAQGRLRAELLRLAPERLLLEHPGRTHVGDGGVHGGHVEIALDAGASTREDLGQPALADRVGVGYPVHSAGVALGAVGNGLAALADGQDGVPGEAERSRELAVHGADVADELLGVGTDVAVAPRAEPVKTDDTDDQADAVAVGAAFADVIEERLFGRVEAEIGDFAFGHVAVVDCGLR
jgi:hypothetical protein